MYKRDPERRGKREKEKGRELDIEIDDYRDRQNLTSGVYGRDNETGPIRVLDFSQKKYPILSFVINNNILSFGFLYGYIPIRSLSSIIN